MENIKDKINFIKWQLLARMPKGSIYERVKESLNNDLLESDPFYYIYWLDLNKSILEKYLLGTFGTTNEDYKKFIKWLVKTYGYDNIIEIKVNDSVIKIPKPLYKDYKCFKAEFLDIIMPYLVENRNMVQPFLEGPYEYNDVFLNKGDIVLDLGANFGLFSSLAESKGCNVYAFEPTLRVFNEYLVRLHEYCPNINVINKAVSNISGVSLFNVYENNSSCNCLHQLNTNFQADLVEMETITVDDFVDQNNLSSIDFIKSDIEGSERLMLMGARDTLKEFGPKLAICYYHKLDDLKVLRELIMDANPKYEIDVAYKKIYAKIPKRN